MTKTKKTNTFSMMLVSITLVVLGLIFVFFEFFLPGGLSAILGGILIIMGIIIFSILPLNLLSKLLFSVGACALVAGVCGLAFYIIRRKSNESIFLSKCQEGFTAASIEPLPVESKGKAISDLKPSGFVNINGKRFQAVSEGLYLKKGTPILVKARKSSYLIVSTYKKENKNVDYS